MLIGIFNNTKQGKRSIETIQRFRWKQTVLYNSYKWIFKFNAKDVRITPTQYKTTPVVENFEKTLVKERKI